ncbi:B-box zinc finger protein 24-like [Phalaenopsis equestris]|uniref:B-box zinc finger protein 24-like n=1 Tax=Phalaenopsis equestris TaxID=78828 RepID=UPI0009E200F9|nr:B-box zinc finger protein 24-like [Phalaenopsis equestris]
MRIACDVCKTTAAAVICCADEAALCTKCDVEVHAANKLAGKHRRLPLNCVSSKLPRCDICQDKAAFIFCVEDRALFCEDCDEAIHLAGTLSANHQRLLATGIRVGLTSIQNMGSSKHQSEPPNCHSMAQTCKKIATKKQPPSVSSSSAWAVDDFLHLPDYESGYKKESSVGFGELPWFADISFSPEGASEGSVTLAEVPEMLFKQPSNEAFYRLPKASLPYRNPRIGMLEDDDFFTVPDLG